MGEKIIQNINNYILENNISLSKLAKAAGIKYNSLWVMLNKHKDVTLGNYVAICKALNEPFDFFIPKE